uniref:WDR59/RTC1-like RING zinc finger domain-containing protein n=1 Tax=Amphimedon queenslandica TaxID=400682 RepID=A0A1X7TBG9_AMPQE
VQHCIILGVVDVISPSHLHANIMCQKCESRLNICSVCHAPVKGLYSMCEVCGHGGHMSHLKEWFSTNSWCPSGCGHNCVT